MMMELEFNLRMRSFAIFTFCNKFNKCIKYKNYYYHLLYYYIIRKKRKSTNLGNKFF